MSPNETEEMFIDGIKRSEEEAEQFNHEYEVASQRIRTTNEAMKRHEYLLRDRPLGKPPDKERKL